MFRHRSRKPRRFPPRRGYTVFEFMIAVILLMAASTITVKIVGWVGAERRSADRVLWVNETLSNAMERVSTEPFETLNTERANALLKDYQGGQALPAAEWSGDVKDVADSKPASKKLTLAVRWKSRSGEWLKPIRLTSWVYSRRNPS